ncbi:MAG: hypothetical protein ACRDAM_15530 [Casimicrobium sp.]
MSLLTPTPVPPEDAWDTLREWRMQSFSKRYKVGLAVMLRLMSLVVGLAGIALFFLEPSMRTAVLVAGLWCVSVPLGALGYVRKMDRMAASVPVSPARNDPTTTVDMRTPHESTSKND